MEKTICVKCQHCRIAENNGVWYNYTCKLAIEETMDYTIGKKDRREQNCREVNKVGMCQRYEQK